MSGAKSCASCDYPLPDTFPDLLCPWCACKALGEENEALRADVAAARIEGAERALLERDVAEVAYHAERCDDVLREINEDVAEGYDFSADDAERERWMRRQLDSMWPWLARAKAVLG